MRSCVRAAVADSASSPLVVTRRRFDRSVRALRGWPWGPLGGLRGRRWGLLPSSLRGWWGSLREQEAPPAGIPGLATESVAGGPRLVGGVWSAFRRRGCGPLRSRCPVGVSCSVSSPMARSSGSGSAGWGWTRLLRSSRGGCRSPLNLLDVLGSWPVYLERGRRGFTGALQVVVSNVGELVDTCSWIDWAGCWTASAPP